MAHTWASLHAVERRGGGAKVGLQAAPHPCRPMAHYGVGPPPSVWWPPGDVECGYAQDFVHLNHHMHGDSHNPCDASFGPLIMHRLGINGGRSLGVCFLHLGWISDVVGSQEASGGAKWCRPAPPSGPSPPATSTCLQMLDI